MLVIFSLKNVIQGHKLKKNMFICLLDHVYQAPFANMKIERQGGPEMSLILGRSGTQYVAIPKELGPSYLKVPSSEQERLQIAKQFEEKWNFPNCLGVIDGKHITLQPPPN